MRPVLIRALGALRERSGHIRAAVLALVGIALAARFLGFVGKLVPIKHWLVWDLLALWGWQLLLAAACLGFGHWLLVRVFRMTAAPGLERLTLSVALGLVAFGTGIYLGGYLGLLGPAFAIAWPTLMVGVGARAGWPALRHALHWWREAPAQRPGLSTIAGVVFGIVCCGLLYLSVLSPDAVNYDASWMHLTIAQDYAREGRIVAFPGNWIKNVPHFGSVVNTWAFLVPGLHPQPLRWMMALHTEFAFILWTLVGIAALARWLLGDRPSGAAWVAFFLFPGIFVYDSNPGGAADHFLAFFAAPLVLAGMRAAETLAPRAWALLGVLAGGALITKVQALYLLAPLLVVVAVAAVAQVLERRKLAGRTPPWRDLALGPALALAGVAVVTAPHFLKNWIIFHNPLYPMAQGLFTGSTPTMPDAAVMAEKIVSDWRFLAPKAAAERVLTSLKLVLTFSFEPHYSFINSLPVFGSLLTLSLAFVPFVRGARRLWVGLLISLGAIFMWAFTYRVDRNLQVFTPVLAATTAVLLARAAAAGWLGRVGAAALVFAQLAWGCDLMIAGNDRGAMGVDRLASGVSLIRSSYEGRGATRYASFRQGYIALGRALPRDAVVLLHDGHMSLGINRRVLLDWISFQGLIDYRTCRSARDVWQRLHDLGVTHIVSQPGSRPAWTKQEEAVWAAFRAMTMAQAQSFSGLELVPMAAAPPPFEEPYQVLMMGIEPYRDGVYRADDLGTIEQLPPELQKFASPRRVGAGGPPTGALGQVKVAMLASGVSLPPADNELLLRDFRRVLGYPAFAVYVRNP
jgi:hypothetical protein